jgi:predicted PurR-regulated permease PerM
MSNETIRREIEELRDLVNAISAEREKTDAVAQRAENSTERGAEDSGDVDDVSKGQFDKEIVRHDPTDDAQRSTVADSGKNADISAPWTFDRPLLWTVIFAVMLTLLVVGRDFLVPLAVAIFMWNLLNALAAFIGRIRIGRSALPGWLTWTLAIFALFLVGALVYWILTSQTEAMYAAAPVYQANFAKLTAKLKTLIGIEKMPTTDRLMESLNLGALLSWLGGAVGSILGEIVLVVIYVAFLLAEQRHLPEKIDRLASNEDNAKRIRLLTSTISKQVQTYVWIKTVVSILTGFVSYVILRLVGVDFAAVWALIIFLLNYVPTVGSALGVVFPALLTLVQFETLTPFVLIVIGLGATQFVIGNVVEPALMGKSLNLSSFVIILSLTFWGMIWGIAGMVLCVPITVSIAIVCSNFNRLHWIAVLLSADGRVMVPSRNA